MQSLGKKRIDKIFKEASSQAEYIHKLYEAGVQGWDQVTMVRRNPRVSKKTNLYIFEKALKFDSIHCPEVFAMGAWLNLGFSTDEDLPDWQVYVDDQDITYKPKEVSCKN